MKTSLFSVLPSVLVAAGFVQACATGTGSASPPGPPSSGDDAAADVATGAAMEAGAGADVHSTCGDVGQPCCVGNYCHGGLACTPTDVCVAMPGGDDGGQDSDAPGGGDASTLPDTSTGCTGQGMQTCGGSCIDTSSDPRNCGACGHDCQTTACTNGICASIVVSTQFVPPGRLTIDATTAYWTSGDGTVRSAPLAGGGATTTLAQGLSSPLGIGVDAQSVYATSQDGRIVSAPIAGSATLNVLATGQPTPYALAVDGTSVYWTNRASGAGNGSLMACARAGCANAPTTLASGLHLQEPRGLAVANGALFWTSFNFGGEINRIPTTGGQFAAVGSGLGYPYQLAISGTTVVTVLYGQGGAIATFPATGGPTTNLVGGQSFPTEGTADATSAYWTLTMPAPNTGATLMKCALATGQTQVLATGSQPAGSVAVDGTWVYWLSNEGKVLKTAK